MREQCRKTFEAEHGSTPGMAYQILIRYRGVIIENIHLPTMQAAFEEMERRGYYFIDPMGRG